MGLHIGSFFSRIIKSKTVIGAIMAAGAVIYKSVDPAVSAAVIGIIQGVGVILAAIGIKHGQEKATNAAATIATDRAVHVIKNQIY